MRVTRVHTEHGSHIEPPIDQSWPDLKRLQWQAGVASLGTGITITVTMAKYWVGGVRQYGHYNVSAPGSTSGPHTYAQASDWLLAMVDGARAARSIR